MADYLKTRAGVLVPPTFAEPPPATGKPDESEIATIMRDAFRITFGNLLLNDDDTLIARGQGKGLKIYDELRRDAQAAAVLDKRELAVIARPWDVTPASDAARDVEAAEIVKENVRNLSFDRITRELLDATLKGYAVGEIMWGVRGARIVAEDVIPRSQRRFVFDLERRLRMVTRQNMYEGEPMPDYKFIVHSVGGKDGSPYGLGVGSRLFWPVFFKRQGITFWLIFCDKFGSPTALGKYPRGSSEPDQARLLQALRAIAQDAGIIVPEGMEIELLEAARSGSIDTYERLCRYMDEQITLAVLGETMTSTAQAAGLGSGQANVHNEVRKELAQADADLLSDTLNRTLVRWLVDYNVPGAGYPRLYRNFSEQDDLNKRAERDTKIRDLGYEPTEDYIAETYGPGWQKSAAPQPSPGAFGAPATDSAAFAEAETAQRAANRSSQDEIAAAAEVLSAEWQRLLGPRIEDIVTMAEQSGDFAEFRAQLAALLDRDPPKELVDALARAQFTAGLAGRSDRSRA